MSKSSKSSNKALIAVIIGLVASLAAIAAGADGLIIEVHNNPPCALCDGAQSLTPAMFAQLVAKLHALAPIVERTL